MELCKSRISRHFSTGFETEELAVLLLLRDEPEIGLRVLVAGTTKDGVFPDLVELCDPSSEDFGNETLEIDFG